MLARRYGALARSSKSTARCLLESTTPSRLAATALTTHHVFARHASGSSTRWLSRQGRDPFTRASKIGALKSRAAFKLLEIDEKHSLFKPGQTVVDLGYAPGSWSQVAISRVRPGGKGKGRVVGIDVIPAQPPKGVSTIQGDFLSPGVRQMVIDFVQDESAGRPVLLETFAKSDEEDEETDEEAVIEERAVRSEEQSRVVHVVLSDMSEPWPMATAWLNSVVNPWRRMMNTSGNAFKDHAGSMDLCLAALSFSYDTLVTGGHFLCKYYQGSEDKDFESRLKVLFEKVHRIKPESSRKESREAYFLGLRRKADVLKEDVFHDT